MSDDGTHRTVVISGELDATTADHVHRLLVGAMEEATTRVTADLSGVTFIGSAGVRCLLSVNHAARERGITFLVARPSTCVEQIIEITGIDGVLHVHPPRSRA